MAVLGASHTHAPRASTRARSSALALLTAVLRRLADGPLDSPVLLAIGGPAGGGSDGRARPTVRMRASWRTVTAADGTHRLEAHWRPDR
ncbi:hypothetical protein AB0D08_22290 [Kitasatospora sp. NPDC048540]|uniref:hypothetical protein n=1 Tax=unclassified Kitasatospora TaxID=2633591 RepID=UPI0009EA26AE|nr:hypothetical protein [Kitasatospora sp. MBT63]